MLSSEQKLELLQFLLVDDSCECQNCAYVYGVVFSDKFPSFRYDAEKLYKQMKENV